MAQTAVVHRAAGGALEAVGRAPTIVAVVLMAPLAKAEKLLEREAVAEGAVGLEA